MPSSDTQFKKGHTPANPIKKGEHRGEKTQFAKGLVPWNTGKKMSAEHRKKLSEAHKGNVHSEETKRKMSAVKKGVKPNNWIADRELIKKGRRGQLTSEYKNWCKSVYKRDNFKCKMANADCKGRIEAHHILRWRDYPELRYDINNGITLCHFHHPLKKVEMERMIPEFQYLVQLTNY